MRNNSWKLWKTVGEVTGNWKAKDKFVIEQSLHGEGAFDKNKTDQVTNSFDEHYVDLGAKLASEVPNVASNL